MNNKIKTHKLIKGDDWVIVRQESIQETYWIEQGFKSTETPKPTPAGNNKKESIKKVDDKPVAKKPATKKKSEKKVEAKVDVELPKAPRRGRRKKELIDDNTN